MNKKYRVGIVIGRFQPFHKGHRYLISKALENTDKIFILVAAANLHDDDNPYPSVLRKRMVRKFINKEGYADRVIKIISQNNHPDDSVWYRRLIKKTGRIDVVIGNNEWVNGIFEGFGVDAIRIGHYNRAKLEGYKIRKLMRENKNWKERVPEYLIKEIDTNI